MNPEHHRLAHGSYCLQAVLASAVFCWMYVIHLMGVWG